MGGALFHLRRGRLSRPSGAFRALPEKLREPHRGPGSGLHLALDRAAILAQDFEGGVRHFTLASQLTDDAWLHQNLALGYELLGRAAEAEGQWDRYLDLLSRRIPAPPGQPAYLRRLAYERLGQKEKAAGSYAKALNINDKYQPAQTGFARVGGRIWQSYQTF